MSMLNIFPEVPLSVTEKEYIAQILSKPEIKKYFLHMASNIGRDIGTSVIPVDESAESWIRKDIFLKGQLEILNSLLSIQSPSNKEE